MKICRSDGQKKDLFLGSLGAFVFNLNTSVGTRLDCHLEVHHKIPSDKNLGFRVFIDWMEVEETAGCSGDYLQFGRDTFVVTDRISQKFCNKVPAPIMQEDSEGRVTGWDFRMVSKESRTWIEQKDYEFDIWLNLKPSRMVKGLRLIVTPFRKSCSEQDLRSTLRYSHCERDSGRCHNTQLFCKNLVTHVSSCFILTTVDHALLVVTHKHLVVIWSLIMMTMLVLFIVLMILLMTVLIMFLVLI